MSGAASLLEEYYTVTQQIESLQKRKSELRKSITDQIKQSKIEQSLTVGTTVLRASIRTSTVVDYDVDRLRQRLGERIKMILEPDVKKIKKNLAELHRALEPHIDVIGSVSRHLVQQHILAGDLSCEDFAGLFSKKEKTTLYVRLLPTTSSPKRAPY